MLLRVFCIAEAVCVHCALLLNPFATLIQAEATLLGNGRDFIHAKNESYLSYMNKWRL